MNDQSLRNVETDVKKPRSFQELLLIGLAGALGIFLASQVLNRLLAFEFEEGPDDTWVMLVSPFGTYSLRSGLLGNRSLLFFVHPSTEPVEQASIDWNVGAEKTTMSGRQLTVLTFESGGPFEQLRSWYQERLGSGFIQNKGWAAGSDDTSNWAKRVENQDQPDAIAFRQELRHRIRGVLLVPRAATNRTRIRLFDYMETLVK